MAKDSRQVNLSKSERKDIYHALCMWANYVETGDVGMSAKSAEQCGFSERINTLSSEQRSRIDELRTLSFKVLKADPVTNAVFNSNKLANVVGAVITDDNPGQTINISM